MCVCMWFVFKAHGRDIISRNSEGEATDRAESQGCQSAPQCDGMHSFSCWLYKNVRFLLIYNTHHVIFRLGLFVFS